MITLEMLTEAIYSMAGLIALAVVLTQIGKDAFNKQDKRWVSHLISWIVGILLNFAVWGVGQIWQIGMYAEVDLTNIQHIIVFAAGIVSTALAANGTWSYEFVKKFLEWIHLLPKNTPVENKTEE